jgi:hypothetical protein
MTLVRRTYHREEDVEENRTQARQDEQMGLEGDGQSDLDECENESVHVVPRAVAANFDFEN